MSSAVLVRPLVFPSFALPVGERQVGFAVAVSLLIHGVALGWLPGLTQPLRETPLPLIVQLSLPPPSPPEAVAVPPAPTLAPAPSANRRETLALQHPLPPVLTAAAVASEPEAVPSRPLAAPSVPPPVEAPRPAAVASPARPPVPDAAVLAAYGRELAGAVATRQRYPRLAQMRQWQGTAVLQLELAAAGGLLAVRVLSSSGHEILDRQAVDMVREAIPLPPLPDALAGRPLTVDVPVVFRLAS